MKNTLAVMAIAIALTTLTCGISFGAGPTTVEFNDVIKGGYAEGFFSVSTGSEENLSCTAEVSGPVKDWVTLDVGDGFVLPGHSGKKIKVILQPPLDTPNGKYTGKIRISAAPISSVESGAGMAVGAGVEINLLQQ